MLRVVIDARSVVGRKSGIGNYVEALLRHMLPLADDVAYLLLRHPSVPRLPFESERVEQVAFGGETKSVRTVFALGLVRSFSEFDVYHSPADLVPLGLGCPYVVTIHDLMWIEARQLASAFVPVRVANGLWYTWNIARAVRDARAIIAISEATADAIARVFPEHVHKVRVIQHGIEYERYAPERAGPRSLLREIVPPDVRYSLIVGQGSPYKNHAAMIRAFVEATADVPDHKLVLVRRFTRIDRQMKRLLSGSRVREKVIVVPFVSDDVLLALYRHAHMLLFASLYEGFGLPALEAMALGTPVLGSTTPAVAEVTGDAALAAHPADHADLVAKIRRLDRDVPLRERLVRAGLERAKQFRWEECARLHLETYRAARDC